ncbi:caspase-1-like [Ochlerotatus camptorhynchus]|uniref:caspase-1-like n=1 Tax=Ochlerotatus camptorhynchus TaxID=644619 RepID=UPI0031D93ACE
MDPSVNLRQEQLVDLVDAKSTLSGSGSDEADAAGFNESKPVETLPVGPIPKRKGSVFLNTPTAPNAKLYSMNGAKRGKVLIFDQVTFDDKSYPKRTGTDKDVERLYHGLPRLGFQKENIEVYEDMNSSEIYRTAVKLENDADLEKSDCLVVVILTHGEENDMLMAKDGQYSLYKFIENFTPTTLNSMAGKPKLFIVQACRGKKLDHGVQLRASQIQTDSAKDQVDSQTKIFTYPEFADLVVVMSSHHGHYSFRNEQGSWLIQELCTVIESCDLETDSIYDILTETNNAVSKRISNSDGELDKKKQIPSFYSTLTKKLYFRPSK